MPVRALRLIITLALCAASEYTESMLFERQRLLLALVAANGGNLNRVDLQKLLFLYTQTCEQTVLANEPDAVSQIAAWVTGGACVALTCYESQPEYCHRTRVARAVAKKIGAQAADL